MRIDLHCHTKKVKVGDAYTRNVDADKFAEKITEADVKIVAITNHNHFDLEQYTVLKCKVKDYCSLWPGVEIDIQGKKNRGHLIVIANPKNVDLFNKKVREFISDTNPDTFIAEVKTVFEYLNQCDVLYIPHFHKDPKLSEEDIEELNEMLEDKSRLFKETSDYRSLGVFSNFDYSMIIGSDIQDWNCYENSKFADIRLPIQTFEQFCLLARKDKQIIDTLLNKKRNTKITVTPHKSVYFQVPIYEDVNIIFGQKGTGKSEIIKSLSNYYEEKSTIYRLYVGNEKENDFEKILNSSDMKRDVSILGISDFKEEFKEIYEWQDEIPTALSNYIEWMETKDNNKNKSKMKMTNAVKLESVGMDRKIDKDYRSAKEFSESTFSKIDYDKYLLEDESNNLIELLRKLCNRIYKSKVDNWQNQNSTKLTNWSIDKIKSIADKCSNTVSKPSTTGFVEFATNRFRLFELASTLAEVFNTKEVKKTESLGLLEEKGDIYVQSRYRLLCDESRTSELQKGIKKLRECRKVIEDISTDYVSNNVFSLLTKFREYFDEGGIKDISYFLGVSKDTVLEDGTIYQPSSGERGILLMQQLLDSDSDVYLMDEPELGMGNSYINSTILPKIVNLAKRRKTVIIATHNSNIAVRTLPYVSIFRSHQNGKYATFVGNPFCDELVDLEDENDVKNWTLESMHTLEGGKDAFYERKDIYESGRKNN